MVPDEVRRLYQDDLELLRLVAGRVHDQLMTMCNDTGYGFAPRPSAVKSLESTSAKLESGRFASWSELDDLVACTVIVPTRANEKPVLDFLRETFQEYVTRTRLTTEQDPAAFRFGATRFIGSLRSKVPEIEPLLRFRFEVQIRTAFEHAWSVTTHALSYKSDRIDWRLERVTAQLKASVEQLDMLVDAFETNAQILESQSYRQLDAETSILEHFKRHAASGAIPVESIPRQWSVFAKNVHALIWKNRGRRRPTDFPQMMSQVLDACDRQLENGGLAKSISLFQFVLGTMLENNLAEANLAERYFAIVTPSLEMCFPATSRIPSSSRCSLTPRNA